MSRLNQQVFSVEADYCLSCLATVTKECGGEARLDKGSVWRRGGLVCPSSSPSERSNVSADAFKSAQVHFLSL